MGTTSTTIPRPLLVVSPSKKILFVALMERHPFRFRGLFQTCHLGTPVPPRPCCGLAICPDLDLMAPARPPAHREINEKARVCLFFFRINRTLSDCLNIRA